MTCQVITEVICDNCARTEKVVGTSSQWEARGVIQSRGWYSVPKDLCPNCRHLAQIGWKL